MTFPKLLAASALLLPAAAWGQATAPVTGAVVKNGSVQQPTVAGTMLPFPVGTTAQPGVVQLGTAAGTAADGGAVAAATATLAPAYLGAVATRGRTANAFIASNTQFMSRSLHIMRDNVTALTVLFPTWWVNTTASGAEETNSGSNETIHASIEYPVGTETPLTCNGTTAAVVVTDGSTVTCTATITLSAGSAIYVREWANMPSGIIFSNSMTNTAIYTNDSLTFGTSVTDQTAGGTVANTGAPNVAVFPLAILGQTRKPSACLVSDSRGQGVYDIRAGATGDGGELARYVGPRMAYIDMSAYGDIAVKAAASYTKRAPLLANCSIMFNELGVNDFNNGYTVAQTEAARKTIDGLFTGRIIGTTLVPWTGSVDGWTSLNQTLQSWESFRQQYNTDVRAGLPGETSVLDLAASVDPGNTGFWPINPTANYYTADGVHETRAGTSLELASPVWNAISLN